MMSGAQFYHPMGLGAKQKQGDGSPGCSQFAKMDGTRRTMEAQMFIDGLPNQRFRSDAATASVTSVLGRLCCKSRKLRGLRILRGKH